jgi:hypothetical protein
MVRPTAGAHKNGGDGGGERGESPPLAVNPRTDEYEYDYDYKRSS